MAGESYLLPPDPGRARAPQLVGLPPLLASSAQQPAPPRTTPPPPVAVTPVPPPVPTPPPPPPPPANAVTLGVTAGPALPLLEPPRAELVWSAFHASCPALLRRQDASGLTRGEDWRPL